MFPGVCIAIPHWRDNGKQFSMHRSELMEPRTLQYMAEASNGEQRSGSPHSLVRRVCTDSREVQEGDLFVALRGDRFDGHCFLAEAAAKKVAGALIERARAPASPAGLAVIAVDNTRTALGRVGARYRRDFALPIIAVAGSNGKTTTKELVAAVLRQKFRTLSSRASFNNDIGVPTTLLQLEQQHEVAVLEFGTNHPGELSPLLALAQPRYGVLTSIGREHLEFFGSLEGVIQEEGALAESIPTDGKLFVNGDAPGLDRILRRSAAPVVRVGVAPGNHWRGHFVRLDADGIRFRVEGGHPAFEREFELPLLGRHQLVNALLALALGAEFGLSPEQVQSGLKQCPPSKMRLQPWAWEQVQFLDDSYNANADSMRAALETLRDYPCRGRRVAVLGDMAELGSAAAPAHTEIGHYAAGMGVAQLFAVGQWAPRMAQAAREAGLGGAAEFPDTSSAAEALRQFLRPGDVVLLKASRAMGLERVGELLRQSPVPFGQGAQPSKGPGRE